MLSRELGSHRYSDPDLPLREHPAEVLPQEIDKLHAMMLDLLQQPEHFQNWFGEFTSQSRHELDISPPEPPYQASEIYDLLMQGEALLRLGGLRALRIGDNCFVNGELIDTPHFAAADALCQHFSIDAKKLGNALEDPAFLTILSELVNSGYWYFKD